MTINVTDAVYYFALQVIWIRYYHDTDTSTQLQEIASNTDLPDNTKFSIDKPTTYSWRLRVKNVQVKDTGEYVCFVRTTSINKKESSMKIFVNGKQAITEMLSLTTWKTVMKYVMQDFALNILIINNNLLVTFKANTCRPTCRSCKIDQII